MFAEIPESCIVRYYLSAVVVPRGHWKDMTPQFFPILIFYNWSEYNEEILGVDLETSSKIQFLYCF